MKKKINKLLGRKAFKVAVFSIVFVFTFILRAHNYDRTPTSNHLDEMLYAWSGLYLIEDGVPVSWSTLDYPKSAEVFKGKITYKGGLPETSVTLYKPWLDEPPLFSYIVGWFAHQYQAEKTDFVPSSYIRMPVIFMSSITAIFIFFIARLVSGYWTGILSMLLYGTIPIIVIASRTALPENLIALSLSVVVYFLLRFIQKPSFWWVLPIPLIVGISGLAKPTGYFLLPLALFLVFTGLYSKAQISRAVKYCLYLILATLPFIGLYYWYGLSLSPEIFLRLHEIQSNRPVGFNSLSWFFISPAYRTVMLHDSWYVFALLSAAYFIFSPLEGLKKYITISFIYWLAVVMITGGENDLLPWYRFPAFPMLSILAAWGIQLIVKRADFFATFLAAGLLLGNRLLLVNAFRPNISTIGYRLIFSGLVLPSLLGLVFSESKLSKMNIPNLFHKVNRLIIIGIIIAGLYMNAIYIYSSYDIECENQTCPMVPSTWLSTVHFPVIWRLFTVGGYE